MYVTNANECYALDAGSGRRIWHFRRPRTKGLAGDAAAGINRGVAVGGDRVFMVTDDARLLALNRFTGALLWDTEMADWRQNYGATSAPLTVGRPCRLGHFRRRRGRARVSGGVRSGDRSRGLAILDRAPTRRTGRRDVARTRPRARVCVDVADRHLRRGARHAVLADRQSVSRLRRRRAVGDNLYSDSILALEPSTGRLKWHFQYTPHDVWDWDAQQPPVLVDALWQGQPRRLLLHANRNGFFYVLDRVSGALLQATPFVKKLTWARGIGPDGRPLLQPDQAPTAAGVTVCPAVEGATNWFSTAFSPATGLYYVQALEKCTVYTRSPSTWQAGRSFYSGSTRNVEGEAGAESAARAGHSDRRGAMGGAAGRTGHVVGRRPGHGRRAGLLRRRQRGAGRRRLGHTASGSGSSRPTCCGRPRR